jgi:hypothetical protein
MSTLLRNNHLLSNRHIGPIQTLRVSDSCHERPEEVFSHYAGHIGGFTAGLGLRSLDYRPRALFRAHSSISSAKERGLCDGTIRFGRANPTRRKASMPPDTDRGHAVLCVRDQDPHQTSYLYTLAFSLLVPLREGKARAPGQPLDARILERLTISIGSWVAWIQELRSFEGSSAPLTPDILSGSNLPVS